MKKILFIFGTRPEAIKMAPLIKETAQSSSLTIQICVTGQHREMLDQVLQLFGICPDYDLNIMQPGQDLYDITSRILTNLRDVLHRSKPDLVLVHGDTTTSMAAAMAAFYQQIPVGHIEAGLRTHQPYNPWPEEMNRQITGRIATWHFAPTQQAKANLLAENCCPDHIFVTGNTVIDALLWINRKIEQDKTTQENLVRQLNDLGIPSEKVADWKQQKRRLVLITGHRRENFGEGFMHICQAINQLSTRYPQVDFVYPVHLNPNVRQPVTEILGSDHPNRNIYLIPPLEYLPFIFLMGIAYFLLTDSGGIQEEAPGLGKPVLVMRETTERPEALKAGTAKLTGTRSEEIIRLASSLLDDPDEYSRMSKAVNPYGDGKAARYITDILEQIL